MPVATRMRRVLVTDAGRGSALAIIRSLARHGWQVTAADADALGPGLYSRYAHDRGRYAPPRVDPDRAVADIRDIVRARRIDVVVPVTDDVIAPLAAMGTAFVGCEIAGPPEEALAKTQDKGMTIEIAESLGIPVPRTRIVRSSAEALEQASGLGWPVVVKPARSKRYEHGQPLDSFAVTYAENDAQLRARIDPVVGRSAILLQEYYAGEGHGIGMLLHEGRPLAAFQHRRLREYPLTGGTSSYRESVALDPVLYDYSARLLGALRWTGIALVEFKIGERGPRLMEVNGRVWGSLPLAVRSGVDFPAQWLELYRSGPPAVGAPPQETYTVGVRSRDLATELAWIRSSVFGRRTYAFERRPHSLTVLSAVLGLLSPSGHDVRSLEDPLPGVIELVRTVVVGSRRAPAKGSSAPPAEAPSR